MEPGAKEREVPASTGLSRAQVLKHPLRARIAAELEKRSVDPPELAEALGEPLPRVAYHCDVLAEAGLAGARGIQSRSGGLRGGGPPAGP